MALSLRFSPKAWNTVSYTLLSYHSFVRQYSLSEEIFLLLDSENWVDRENMLLLLSFCSLGCGFFTSAYLLIRDFIIRSVLKLQLINDIFLINANKR